MRVHVPPKMDAKERGMKSCDGAMPHFFDHFWRMGDHDGDDGRVVEKRGDEGDGDHEADLGARHRLGGTQELTHVVVQRAGVADARGDDEEARHGQQPFVAEALQTVGYVHDVRGEQEREGPEHQDVGTRDVPHERHEAAEHDTDGVPSLPRLSHGGRMRIRCGRRTSL